MKRMTLREIGERIGKSIGYLSDIEHDRKGPPDLKTIEQIEILLGVSNNSLVKLAAEIRRQRPQDVSQRIRMRPILSEILLRADEFSDDELKEILKQFDSKESKDRWQDD